MPNHSCHMISHCREQARTHRILLWRTPCLVARPHLLVALNLSLPHAKEANGSERFASALPEIATDKHYHCHCTTTTTTARNSTNTPTKIRTTEYYFSLTIIAYPLSPQRFGPRSNSTARRTNCSNNVQPEHAYNCSCAEKLVIHDRTAAEDGTDVSTHHVADAPKVILAQQAVYKPPM